MKIVHLVCTDAFAGVERHIAVLAAGQSARGHQVVVLGGAPKRMPGELGQGPVWRPSATLSEAITALANARGADIVHAHMTTAELAAVLTSPYLRAPIVSTRHFARRRGSTTLAKAVGTVTASRLAAQISISEYVAQHIEGPSTVVYPGVATPDVVRPAASRAHVVLLAQRLEPEKRSDLALRAYAHSGLGESGWKLLIAGDGSRRADLERLCDDLGVATSCRFLGARPDVTDLLSSAAVLLAPCPIDGLGLSVVEAMASGLPVVAAAAGGHLETVGAVPEAVLYPVEDFIEAGRSLRALATDVAARETYGRRLHDAQQQLFSIDRQVEDTIAVYDRVLL